MKLLHSKKDFYAALDKITTINQERIESKLKTTIENIHKQQPNLDVLLLTNDNEIKPLLTQHCNKSGKELNKISLEYFTDLVVVHGRDKAVELLKTDACHHYSPLWLHTDPDSLHKLMAYDTAGYFVYAASHIFHSDIVKKANLLHSAPETLIPEKKNAQTVKEAEKKVDATASLNLLDDFPTQDKPIDLTLTEIPASTDIRFFNLQDKIISRRNIELYIDDVLITECNELLRRFLGLAKPEKVANKVKFSFEHLYQITESSEAVLQFINELKTAIKLLFENHFKSLKQKKIEQYYINLNKHKQLSSSDIESVKAAFNGLTNFHMQPKIRNQTKKESILYDLRGFWDENIENDDMLKSFNAHGPSKRFDSDNAVLDTGTKNQLNRFTCKKGIKIKVKSS